MSETINYTIIFNGNAKVKLKKISNSDGDASGNLSQTFTSVQTGVAFNSSLTDLSAPTSITAIN